MGLQINQAKIKSMASGKAHRLDIPTVNNIGNYYFDRVESFTYYGSIVKWENRVSKEIGAKLLAENGAYYSFLNHLKGRLIARKTKLLVYKTPIRTILN